MNEKVILFLQLVFIFLFFQLRTLVYDSFLVMAFRSYHNHPRKSMFPLYTSIYFFVCVTLRTLCCATIEFYRFTLKKITRTKKTSMFILLLHTKYVKIYVLHATNQRIKKIAASLTFFSLHVYSTASGIVACLIFNLLSFL